MAASQARSVKMRRVASSSFAEGVIVIRAGGRRRVIARSITFATRSGPAPSRRIGPSYAPFVTAPTVALKCA
jgi:hypothetical protein